MVALLFCRATGVRVAALCLVASGHLCSMRGVVAQLPDSTNAVSVRSKTVDKPSKKLETVDVQRERLFNELAEEFNTFDRLANLVRRVSQLVKPSVVHIEAHKTEGKGGASYDEAGSGVVIRELTASCGH